MKKETVGEKLATNTLRFGEVCFVLPICFAYLWDKF